MHGVISSPGWEGDETFDPKRSLLSERHQGAMAERVAVPRRNVVPKPASLSFAEAACLPDGLADGVPDALQPRRAAPRRDRAGAGCRRRGGDGRDRARPGGRPAGAGDQPRRGQAGQGARDRRPRGLRVRRPAPGEGGRGDRDGREGDVVALDPLAAARRPDHHLRDDLGTEPRRRRAHPDLLPPALGDRLHDGHPRRAGGAGDASSTRPAPGRSSTASCRWTRPGTASPRWPRATCSARSSSPDDAHPPAHRRRLRDGRGPRRAAARARGLAPAPGSLDRARPRPAGRPAGRDRPGRRPRRRRRGRGGRRPAAGRRSTRWSTPRASSTSVPSPS